MDEHQGALGLIQAEDTLPQAADKLAQATRDLMTHAHTEEDLRIGFETLLAPLREALGIAFLPRYEKAVSSVGRSDAVHGQVIIEYEPPSAFDSPAAVEHAFEQLVGYIQGEAQERKDTLFLLDPKFVGVGFDGQQMFFVHYRGDKARPKSGLDKEDFARIGPYPFDRQSARTLLTYLRALRRRLLTAPELAEVFGPAGNLAREAVAAYADALVNWNASPRVEVFFREWQRLFGIVYGEHFNGNPTLEKETLARMYPVGENVTFQQLLFSIHTYFVFLMKLIAAELVTISETSLKSSFSDDLAHSDGDGLFYELHDVENGGTYARRRITNFLEGDFFQWYLDAFSPRVEDSIRQVARALAEFEPGTPDINPEAHRDLLKKLYQYLVPAEVRHRLGEYYTPDWLAELVLDEAGYEGDPRQRILDPACGSGTFLVLAIQRARKFAQDHGLSPLTVLKGIVSNVWGFDLNPLAVIAARTNYLFALGELAGQLPTMEIPIYLADSVLWPRESSQLRLDFGRGETISVPTSVGVFHVPRIWILQSGFLMRVAAPLVEDLAKAGYSVPEALKLFRKAGAVYPPHEEAVTNFYTRILELEKEGKNGIWARLLKNSFAPLIAESFDLVVGNPPWVRWGYLSKEYRAATLEMWKKYGLFSLKGHAARLGGGEKDFSMLFAYAALDYYVRDKGRLAFLITQEVFKGKGAGEGFRRFSLGDKGQFKVLKAHDLVTVQPFEGATNKTAMIVVEKGQPTRYPVRYTLWSRKKGVGKIPTDLRLPAALLLLNKEVLSARPIGKPTGSWQTVSKSRPSLAKIQGTNLYRARRGASTEPYGVFWLDVKQVMTENQLLVRNMPERGKRVIHPVEALVESALVFPAVRGADIQRWRATPGIYVLMCQDPRTCQPFPESVMKAKWPRTFSYLTRFKEVLLTRGSKTVRELAERTAFYAMFGIGPYTVARHKVVWKRMASDLVAAVISEHKTPYGYKKVIPTDTTSLFPTESEDEAHYLCAVLNSNPVREFIRSFSSAGRGFGAPSVMEPVGIPQFSAKKPLHLELAALSLELHRKKAEGLDMECPPLERNVDKAVRRLFGIAKRA